jgi:hypothetical protein
MGREADYIHKIKQFRAKYKFRPWKIYCEEWRGCVGYVKFKKLKLTCNRAWRPISL